MEQQHAGLDIDDDLRQQQREWMMQRIAWLFLLALLIATTLGLFGKGGPLSKVEKKSEDGSYQIEYERFMRNHSPDSLRVSTQAQSGSTRVKIDRQYIAAVKIEKVIPEPERVISEEGAVTFVFHTRPKAELNAVFHFSPERVGTLEGWTAVEDKPPLLLSQFVYP